MSFVFSGRDQKLLRAAAFSIWEMRGRWKRGPFEFPISTLGLRSVPEKKETLFSSGFKIEVDPVAQKATVRPTFKCAVNVRGADGDQARAALVAISKFKDSDAFFIFPNKGLVKEFTEETSDGEVFSALLNISSTRGYQGAVIKEHSLKMSSIPYFYIINNKRMVSNLSGDISDANFIMKVRIANGELYQFPLFTASPLSSSDLLTPEEIEEVIANSTTPAPIRRQAVAVRDNVNAVSTANAKTFLHNACYDVIGDPNSQKDVAKSMWCFIGTVVEELQALIDKNYEAIVLDTANAVYSLRNGQNSNLPKKFSDVKEALYFLNSDYDEEPALEPLRVGFLDIDLARACNHVLYSRDLLGMKTKGCDFLTDDGCPVLTFPKIKETVFTQDCLFKSIKKALVFADKKDGGLWLKESCLIYKKNKARSFDDITGYLE